MGADWDSYVQAKIEGSKLVLVFLSTVSVARQATCSENTFGWTNVKSLT